MKINISNLTKNFTSMRGDITALDNINLEIQNGEFFVLLGPSGCGKTTLLNLIAGLEKPNAGEIRFDDKTVVSNENKIFVTPKERNVAMVFQSYALYPHLTVFENIAFPLRIAKSKEPEVKEKVTGTSKMLGISSLLDSKPAELSGGQRQRVAIARALVREPSVFLMDEPLSNLDAQLRVSTRSELKILQHKLGITTIYVTHDQTEAMTLGDRIAVLRDGKVEQIGTAKELYEKPVNAFVASFIGTPPMNLVELQTVETGNEFFAVIGDLRIKLQGNPGAQKITLGIRPEHITISKNITDAQSLKGKITSVEPLGKETLVRVSIPGIDFSVLTSVTDFTENKTVTVTFDPAKFHIF